MIRPASCTVDNSSVPLPAAVPLEKRIKFPPEMMVASLYAGFDSDLDGRAAAPRHPSNGYQVMCMRLMERSEGPSNGNLWGVGDGPTIMR